MPPPPSGITTTTTGGWWSGPKGSGGGAAAAGVVLRRRRAAPEPEPEERTTISSCDCDAARATTRALLLRRSGCCCFGESGIRWAGRDCDVGCADWVVGGDDREILATCGGVVTPARSSTSPCSGLRPLRAPTCCAPARAGAPPPGCLCLDVLEEGGGPIPSSTNVCVCPKNLPRRKVPELWGSPPRRHTPRLAVHIVAPELRATVSITYCLFS
jgi:hypothetical protein